MASTAASMSSLPFNISLTWPDPVLGFYPDGFWMPKHQTTSRGSWSSVENGGSGTQSGISLLNFNASDIYALGTSQWSNMIYNASLVPDGKSTNLVNQSAAMEDLTYGFQNGHGLYVHQNMSTELKQFDLNEDPEMESDTTYSAYTNVLSVELVVITIQIPTSDSSSVVVNETIPLTDFKYTDPEWTMYNNSLVTTTNDAPMEVSFSGSNFFLVSGQPNEAGFNPLTNVTLDGVEHPSQGIYSNSRLAWEDGVLLFFSGLEDTNHTLSFQARPPLAIKSGLVFKAGDEKASKSQASADHSSSSRTLPLLSLVALALLGLAACL